MHYVTHSTLLKCATSLGFDLRQSDNVRNRWFINKPSKNMLFRIVVDNQGIHIDDISGNGAVELPHIREEFNRLCK